MQLDILNHTEANNSDHAAWEWTMNTDTLPSPSRALSWSQTACSPVHMPSKKKRQDDFVHHHPENISNLPSLFSYEEHLDYYARKSPWVFRSMVPKRWGGGRWRKWHPSVGLTLCKCANSEVLIRLTLDEARCSILSKITLSVHFWYKIKRFFWYDWRTATTNPSLPYLDKPANPGDQRAPLYS